MFSKKNVAVGLSVLFVSGLVFAQSKNEKPLTADEKAFEEMMDKEYNSKEAKEKRSNFLKSDKSYKKYRTKDGKIDLWAAVEENAKKENERLAKEKAARDARIYGR